MKREFTPYSAHAQRSCHELGVCLHPSQACTGACQQLAMPSLTFTEGPALAPASGPLPFEVEGPFYPADDPHSRLAHALTSVLMVLGAGVSGWLLGSGLVDWLDWLDALPALSLLGALGVA